MPNGKYVELCNYLSEKNPDCYHYIIAVSNDLDEAHLDVVNRVYEKQEDARSEAKEVLLKIIIKMLEEEKVDPLAYLVGLAAKLTNSGEACACDNKECACKEEELACKEHPKYQGKRKPRSGCEVCLEIYRRKHETD